MKRMAAIAMAPPPVLAGTAFAGTLGASSDSSIVLAQRAAAPTASPPAPSGADISTAPGARGAGIPGTAGFPPTRGNAPLNNPSLGGTEPDTGRGGDRGANGPEPIYGHALGRGATR